MMKIYLLISCSILFLFMGCNHIGKDHAVFSVKYNFPEQLKQGENKFSFDVSNLTDKNLYIKEKTIGKSCIILHSPEDINKEIVEKGKFVDLVFSSTDVIFKEMHAEYLPQIKLVAGQTIKVDYPIHIDVSLDYKSGTYDIGLEISFYYSDSNNGNVSELYFSDMLKTVVGVSTQPFRHQR